MIRDRESVCRLVNEQSEIALTLSAPVVLFLMAMAPWVVHVLYAKSFLLSVGILRWQVLGDILKVASWPLGYLIVAAGDGKTYFLTETTGNIIPTAPIFALLPVLGLQVTGIAYLATYVVYLPLAYWLAHKRFGFRWSRFTACFTSSTLLAAISIWLLCSFSRWGQVVGCAFALGTGVYSLRRIAHMGSLGNDASKIRAFILQRLVFSKGNNA